VWPACRASAHGSPQLLDTVGYGPRWLMLPHVHNDPAHLLKLTVFLAITFYIPSEFGPPPVTVVLGQNAVLWTGMPEASVDENRDPCRGERDVGSSGKFPTINSKPQASAVQLLPEQYFRAAGGSWHPLHLSRHRSIEGRGSARSLQVGHCSSLKRRNAEYSTLLCHIPEILTSCTSVGQLSSEVLLSRCLAPSPRVRCGSKVKMLGVVASQVLLLGDTHSSYRAAQPGGGVVLAPL
jgi:hypothetical protein